MINRIPDSRPPPKRKGQPPKPASQALSDLAQQQITYRLRQVETYVQAHPVTGIGAALCIGILLGWVIKRR
jgi:ElaB/YqjD/DUF883 family membrane-anchored ribosome-binding protein